MQLLYLEGGKVAPMKSPVEGSRRVILATSLREVFADLACSFSDSRLRFWTAQPNQRPQANIQAY